MIKVVTCTSELESAKRLGYPTETWFGDQRADFNNDIIIRYGRGKSVFTRDGRKTDFKNVINPKKSIRLNCKKNESLKRLARVVNIPTLYEKSVPANVLAVVRPFSHTAGNDFSVKKGPFKLEPETYGAAFLKTNYEYRVWFCGNKTMSAKRVKMSINEDQEFPVRSRWGYSFLETIPASLHHQTLMAKKEIGLDLGAADILFYKGKYYFLELNSAPSLDHRRVNDFFKENVKILIKEKFPNMVENV